MLQKIKNNRYLRILLAVVFAFLLAAVTLILLSRAARQRQDALLAKAEAVWTRAVEGEKDCYLRLTLQDGEMEYRFVSTAYPSLSETFFTYGYTAIDGDLLRVTYPDGAKLDVTVTFSEDGNEMTLSPAVTVAEESETWTRSPAE